MATLTVDAGERRVCVACGEERPLAAFSRNQLAKTHAKCCDCVSAQLAQETEEKALAIKLKRCVQCFQDLEKEKFSKRQYQQLDGKCVVCVQALELDASRQGAAAAAAKWTYDHYYRCCSRGKHGGVSVRSKFNVASPIIGCILLGRVFRATDVLFNEQGDPMVKLASLACITRPGDDPCPSTSEDTPAAPPPPRMRQRHSARDGWVPCRSIRNEILIEPHHGPWLSLPQPLPPPPSRRDRAVGRPCFYRCVIEGCKVRVAPDLSLGEIGYVLYGDVVEVVECLVTPDCVVFFRLHARYFDGPAWVVERTLDNESVLNHVDGPTQVRERYRCVQHSGAPIRHAPSLTAPPVGRVACGAIVTVCERVITPERQVFLRLDGRSPRAKTPRRRRAQGHVLASPHVEEAIQKVAPAVLAQARSEMDQISDDSSAEVSTLSMQGDDHADSVTKNVDGDPPSDAAHQWVIETSTVCATVMTKLSR